MPGANGAKRERRVDRKKLTDIITRPIEYACSDRLINRYHGGISINREQLEASQLDHQSKGSDSLGSTKLRSRQSTTNIENQIDQI